MSSIGSSSKTGGLEVEVVTSSLQPFVLSSAATARGLVRAVSVSSSLREKIKTHDIR